MPNPVIEDVVEDIENEENHEIDYIKNDGNGNLIEKSVVERDVITNDIIRQIVTKYVENLMQIIDKNGDPQELPPPGQQIIIAIQGGA